VGMQGKLNDNVNLFPVHARFKPQWNRVASQLSAMSTVSLISAITTTVPHTMATAAVTSTVAELASKAVVNNVAERKTQQQQQQFVLVDWSSTTERDILTTISSTHGEIQPYSAEAASLSTAIAPATVLSTAATTTFFTATGRPGKATSVAAATVSTSTDASTKITTQPAMAVSVTATLYSNKMTAATQAASTVQPPSTTADAMPASTGGAATVPWEIVVSKSAHGLDNTQATVASTVAIAATVEGTTTALPSASGDSITTLAVMPDDQTEVDVEVLQRLASNSALDVTATSIPVMLGVAGAIAGVFGAFVAWRQICFQWHLCYQTLEEPRRCMLDPELLA